MAEHPGIKLTVLSFTAKPETAHNSRDDATAESEKDKEVFSEFVTLKQISESVKREEITMGSKEDIIAALRTMSSSTLFLVGRTSPTIPLSERSTDCPELGHVGSYLASSDFSTTSSILVIQQYDPSINDIEKPVDETKEASDVAESGSV
ncbi:hypothetical protein V6N13_148765 [Hibiscus sabdariffa]